MWIALNWSLTAFVIACWTGLCLSLQGIGRLLGGAAGTPSDWLGALDRWQIPVWLADWLPMPAVTALKTWLTDAVEAFSPWLDMAASAWPTLLNDWLSPLLWLMWAVVAIGLLAFGVVGHVLVRALTAPRLPATAPMRAG